MPNKILTFLLALLLACAGFAVGRAAQPTHVALDFMSTGASNHNACVMPMAKSAGDNSMNEAMMSMMAKIWQKAAAARARAWHHQCSTKRNCEMRAWLKPWYGE